MKAFNKKTKTAAIIGSVLMSGFVALPAFAEEVTTTNAPVPTTTSFPGGIKSNKNDDFLKNKMENRSRGLEVEKKDDSKKMNPEMLRKALENKNYSEFKTALTNSGITESKIPTESEFVKILEAYNLAKTGDVQGAQKILKENNLNPMLRGLVMGQHLSLTDAQKIAIKNAEELVKQGKTEEARAILVTAGLPQPLINNTPKNTQKEAIKTAIDQAKLLKSEGKTEEAKQVLKDAGLDEKSARKMEKEFNKELQKEKKSFGSVLKNFFKFNRN